MARFEETVEDFRKSWSFCRGLTRQFIEAAPLSAWDSRPHERYGTMARQFRHVVQVVDLYRSALENGHLVPQAKTASYSGSLQREDLLAGLDRADSAFDAALEAFVADGKESLMFGELEMSLGEFLHVCIEHEANHHGLWSVYAAYAGFDTPASWKENWDL